MTIDVAVIGTGPNPDDPSSDGYAMGYNHADAYRTIDACQLVACADIVPENAEAFAEQYGIDHVYEDYREMLGDMSPDLVSVCTPPAVHADIVVGCAESGNVGAIHCEKPMADTWGDSKRMARACDEADVQLTFNHQRRFGDMFRDAKGRIEDGTIGDLTRLEYSWGTFFDMGIHGVDICNWFNGECPAEWVLGSLDYQEENVMFGVHNENQMLAQWRYENGVYGLASTGPGAEMIGAHWRAIGTEGELELDLGELALRVRRHDDDVFETTTYDDDGTWIDRALRDVITSYREGRDSPLAASNALRAMEIIFAGYESVRQSERVDLPLNVDDHPLEAMVNSGTLAPRSTER